MTTEMLYLEMQKAYYDKVGESDPAFIVGNYEYHENVPYETNLLFKYGDLRKPIFPDFKSRRAFDICCGEGRMVRRMSALFGQVDGADISQEMLAHARERSGSDSKFWVTTGANAGDAPSATYDFVYCTISMQHICVFSVRDGIINDLTRILKPDGKMTLQFLYSERYPLLASDGPKHISDDTYVQIWKRDVRHARWLEDKTSATSTNSGCDVVIGAEELDVVKKYFEKYFNSVEYWFYDISVGREEPRQLASTHPNSHLDQRYHGTHFVFIHCSDKR